MTDVYIFSAMKILLSEGAMTALTRLGGYVIESRGHINVKVRTFMHALPRFKTWSSNELVLVDKNTKFSRKHRPGPVTIIEALV